MPPRINIPPLTRGLLLLVLASTLLNSALTYRNIPLLDQKTVGLPFLSIVPRSSIKSPWVFGTSTFVEQNLFSLAASMLTIYYGGRYLERAWGGPEYAKFVLFVIMIPNVLSFVIYWMWYGITGSEARLYVDYNINVEKRADVFTGIRQSTARSLWKPPFLLRSSNWFPSIESRSSNQQFEFVSSISRQYLSCSTPSLDLC